jgi:hypothetical protein
MVAKFILEYLVKQGLSEHLILHIVNGKSCLGHILYDKNRLHLKDTGALAGLDPKILMPCWENGIVGMITPSRNREWESLTYLGVENCRIPVDLNSTRHGVMSQIRNQYGDSLVSFEGSIYRGFKLLLDHHFLPVILLHQVKSKAGIDGLAVSDLRIAPMSIKTLLLVNDIVSNVVVKKLSMNVDETDLSDIDFKKMFGNYLQS